MNELTLEQLPLFLILMLPGLVSRKVYDLQVPSSRDDAGRYVLDALCFGTLNAAVWYIPAAWVFHGTTSAIAIFASMVVILVVSPVGLGVLAVRVLKSDRLRGLAQHPTPMAWDYFFGRSKSCFMLCRLKNGKSLGGYFGPRSFASSFPNSRDIYLEQLWLVDHTGFVAPVADSAGALISFDECELIEFFQAVPTTKEDTERA
jgi:hypothetical protein